MSQTSPPPGTEQELYLLPLAHLRVWVHGPAICCTHKCHITAHSSKIISMKQETSPRVKGQGGWGVGPKASEQASDTTAILQQYHFNKLLSCSGNNEAVNMSSIFKTGEGQHDNKKILVSTGFKTIENNVRVYSEYALQLFIFLYFTKFQKNSIWKTEERCLLWEVIVTIHKC